MWGGGQYSNLFYQRSIYYEAPGQADGPRRLAEMQAPLELSLQGIELSEPPAAGYPRPKGATPTRVPLVPAYEECTKRQPSHGAPLAVPSCNPAVQSSDYLTVGSPEANGGRGGLLGLVRFGETQSNHRDRGRRPTSR